MFSLLLLVLSLSSLFLSTGFAQTQLTAGNNEVFVLNDRQNGGFVSPSVLAQWPQICVKLDCTNDDCDCTSDDFYHAQNQASFPELNGRQRAMAIDFIHGIEVQRKIFVSNQGLPLSDGFIRFVDRFTNPTSSPITFSLRMGTVHNQAGGVGSSEYQVWRTSEYSTQYSASTRWILVDDQDAVGGDPAIALLFHGPGGQVPDLLEYNPDQSSSLLWGYNSITLPRFSTLTLMSFVVVEPSRVDALDEIEYLLRLRSTDATFGLDANLLDTVYNADLNRENTTPLADLNGPYNGVEGQPLQVNASASFDREESPLIYTWDFDHDGEFGEEGPESSGINAVIEFPQNGEYPIALRVEDNYGLVDEDRVIVSIRNARPTIDEFLYDSEIDEGERIEVVVRASDTGSQDILSYAYDWEGTGQYQEGQAQASHQYTQDGVYFGSVRVSDQDGGVTTQSFTVTVRNVAPVIQNIIANQPVLEGDQIQIQVQAYDPGDDQLTYIFDLDGDGADDYISSNPFAETTFEEDGFYVIGVRVQDQQNASTFLEYPISVINAPPQILSIQLEDLILEGQATTIQIQANDAGIYDRLRYEIDLDGQLGYEISELSDVLTLTFADNGRYTGTVRVIDDEGDSSILPITVDVGNQDPSATLVFQGESVQSGLLPRVGQDLPFQVEVNAQDPSAIDQETLIYHWDLNQDGVFETLNGGRIQTLQFEESGNYLIRCKVIDKDLGETTVEGTIQIVGRPPIIQSINIIQDAPYYEGRPLRFEVNAQDPDPLIYSFDFDGDGLFEVENSTQPWADYAFADQGSYLSTVVVQDQHGSTQSSYLVEIQNAPPSVAITVGENVGEGEELNITVGAFDPGVNDLLTVTVEFQSQVEIFELRSGESRLFSLPTEDNGLIAIRASAQDEDGGQSEETQSVAFIENRPPFIYPFEPLPAQEGTRYSAVIPADDPAGPADSLRFSLIDPPPNISINEDTGLILWTPSFEDFLNQPFTFFLLVEDEDGGRYEQAIVIPVLPIDEDRDGIPDTYESQTCTERAGCLDPTRAEDAQEDQDQDGRNALQEWHDQSNPFLFEGPAAPQLLFPQEGDVFTQSPLNFETAWVDSTLPQPAIDRIIEQGEIRSIRLEYEIYSDSDLNDRVFQSDPFIQSATSEQETTQWSLDGSNLEEDQVYWWRVRALDGPAQGPWSESRSFRINLENRAPLTPSLVVPSDRSIVDDFTPTFTFNPSNDPDGDDLYYVVRIYRDSLMGPIAELGGQVEDGEGPLSFTPTNRLQENGRYLWDVVAVDQAGLESEPSEQWLFTIDLENAAPTAPEIYYPSANQWVDRVRPTFQVGGSFDEEGTRLRYHFEVRQIGETEPLAQSGEDGVLEENQVAQWIPDLPLIEDKEHQLSVYASDGFTQSVVSTLRFYVSETNHPPTQPAPLSPTDGALLSREDAICTWGEAKDPEGGLVKYQVQYCEVDQIGNLGPCQESPLLSNRSFNLAEYIPDQTQYEWSVRSLDEQDLSLGYGEKRVLVIQGQSTSTVDEGCHQTHPSPSNIPLLLLLALFLIHLLYRHVDHESIFERTK